MSIFTVVGCGDSARNWVPNGVSIGSNDCEKWGRPVDYLILANHPSKFKDRLKVIKATKAKVMVTSRRDWDKHLPNCIQIARITAFNLRASRGFIYTARTTPIMCVSMALKMGATEIMLWGVDMLTHHAYRQGEKKGDQEIATYKRFFSYVQKTDVKVWRGADGTAFDKVLPLWGQ